MPISHRQFRDVASGIVLVWLDLRIGGFDILPDLLGYALMALALVSLARKHVAFAVAALIATVLGLDELYSIIVATRVIPSAVGIGGLPLVDTELIRVNWSLRTTIGSMLEYAYNIVLTFGLQSFFARRGDLVDSHGAIRLRTNFVYTILFTLVAAVSALALPMLATVLLMPPLVCQIAFTASLVTLLRHAARAPGPDSLLAHLVAPEPPPKRSVFGFWRFMPPTGRSIVGGTLVAYVLAVWWYMVPCSWLDIAVGKSGCAALFEQPQNFGAGVVVSPDSRFVVINAGGQVRQINIASGRVAYEWNDDGSSFASGVALSPDGTTVAAAQRNGIVVWRTGEQIADIVLDAGDDDEGTRNIVFAPDGASFAAADGTGTVYIWRTTDGSVLYRLAGLDAPPLAVRFSAHGTLVAASGRRIAEWRVEDGANVQTLDLPQRSRAIAINNEGMTYAVVNNGAVEQRSVSTGEIVRRFNVTNGDLDARLAFSSDSSLLAVWSSREHAAIMVYRVANGALAGTLRVPGPAAYSDRELRFSSDNRMLVASGIHAWRDNDNVAVWRVP